MEKGKKKKGLVKRSKSQEIHRIEIDDIINIIITIARNATKPTVWHDQTALR